MSSVKKKVLIMAGYYIPSVKGGGPIQSIKNLVDNLSDKIDFYIVAVDRDLGDNKPFENIKVDKWVEVGKAMVLYTNTSKLTWRKTTEVLNSVAYDVLYLNSFFAYKFSTVPILLWKLKKIQKIHKKKLVLAPRGQFSSGALGLKSSKKTLFIKVVRKIGLYNGITWHATADTEKVDIERIFGDKTDIIVANNLTANYEGFKFGKAIKKNKGELKIVFISRIHPKKNLKGAIEFLKSVKGKVEFNIYGPIEDKLYWSECKMAISELSPNIKVLYKGTVEHDEVINIFKQHHVFLFPTLGENFGHVISEALIGGCPVIISNQTPWRDLEKFQAGWDIDLSDHNRFINVIQQCVELNEKEYQELTLRAFEYGKKTSNINENINNMLLIFKTDKKFGKCLKI